MTSRALKESPIKQGENERIAYFFSTVPWDETNNPSEVLVTIYDSKRIDVSATCLVGLPTAIGKIITTPVVANLVAGKIYRLEIKFTISGNVLETFTIINAEY